MANLIIEERRTSQEEKKANQAITSDLTEVLKKLMDKMDENNIKEEKVINKKMVKEISVEKEESLTEVNIEIIEKLPERVTKINIEKKNDDKDDKEDDDMEGNKDDLDSTNIEENKIEGVLR